MAYRAPGAYARFVRTASQVSNPGASRIMGLIGTGLNYYEIYNEPVKRVKDRPYDTLSNPNVMEVLSVSSKAVFFGKNTPDNVFYTQGANADFELKDGQHIVWRTLTAAPIEPAIVNIDGTDPFINEGCKEFNDHITIMVDGANGYLVEDGEWMIEVTYVAKDQGCYRVINNLTKELVGEYVAGAGSTNVIPGCKLTVASTFTAPADASPESEESLISVGDYVVYKTVAGKTEVEAQAAIDATSTTGLPAYVTGLEVINDGLVVDGTYNLVIKDAATKAFQILKGTTVVYPADGTSTAIWTADKELYDIIPGVTLTLKDLKLTINDNDKVVIKTSARIVDETLPGEGDSYYISYKYRKPESGYAPRIFTDYDDVVTEYGNYDVTAAGFVLNSLSLGAEIAFQNGVTSIVCVQAKGNSDREFIAALEAAKRILPGIDNINTIIPLTSSSQVGAEAMKHVELMSSYEHGKERMVYLGAALNQPMTKNPTGADRSVGMIETAQAYGNERVVFVTPGEIVKDIRDLRTGRTNERTLPACYPAIAVAALGLVNDPAEPLTNKQIAGFKYIPQVLMESEKNMLAAAGCLILDQRGSVIKVRHGITTSTTEVNSQEITLIQIKDYVIAACRKATAALYVGQKNRPSVVADVQYTITSILNQFIGQEVLIGFSGLSVKRSTEDPRQIDVKFEIEAVYPLNYINITFGFAAVS